MSGPTPINQPVKVLLSIDAHSRKIALCKVEWERVVWRITKNTFSRAETIGYNRKLYVFSATAEEETGSANGRRRIVGMELTLDNTSLWDFRLREVLYDD